MIPQASLCYDLEAGRWPVWTAEAWPAAPLSLPLARQLKLCQGQDTGTQGAWGWDHPGELVPALWQQEGRGKAGGPWTGGGWSQTSFPNS